MATQLGMEINLFRKNHGYSLETFADRVECSKSYLSMLERGEDSRGNVPRPSTEILERLSKIMGRPIEELVRHSKRELVPDENLIIEKNNGNTIRILNKKNREILYADSTSSDPVPENSEYQKELANLSKYIKGLTAEELRKLHQMAYVMFHDPVSRRSTETEISEENYALKRKRAAEVITSEEALTALNYLEKLDEKAYKSALDSCSNLWHIKNDSSKSVNRYYQEMIQSMEKEIMGKAMNLLSIQK